MTVRCWIIITTLTYMYSSSSRIVTAKNEETWNYKLRDPKGQEHWKDHYLACGKPNQSPIDISYSAMKNIEEKDYGPLNLTITEPLRSKLYRNLGNSLKILIPERNIELRGGCLGDKSYQLQEIRFHWGSLSSRGSEHRIGGMSFPLEVQLYGENKIKHADSEAYAGLAFLFEISKVDNPYLVTLATATQEVTSPGSETLVDIRGLLGYLTSQNKMNTYYCYKGSDTSPPCTGNFTWLVFVYRYLISERQMVHFRNMVSMDRDPTLGPPVMMADNYRQVRHLGKRDIFLVSSFGRAPSSGPLLLSSFAFAVLAHPCCNNRCVF